MHDLVKLTRPCTLKGTQFSAVRPVIIISVHTIKSKLLLGRPCDVDGNTLPQGAPPPPVEEKSLTDWTPFDSRLEFEVADLLFRRDEMAAATTDDLFRLWAADKQDGHPPFANHDDLTEVIDEIKDGNAPWEKFTVTYSGLMPDEEPPSWMTEDFEVSHRDPKQVIHLILANPDFQARFSYAPYCQYELVDRQWTSFMSGNWVWSQAVRNPCVSPHICSNTILGYHSYCS